jgi:hypothetical protein
MCIKVVNVSIKKLKKLYTGLHHRILHLKKDSLFCALSVSFNFVFTFKML